MTNRHILMPLPGVNQDGDDANATIHVEKEQGASGSPPSKQLRTILLDDGTFEMLPRHVYTRGSKLAVQNLGIRYKPSTGTTTIEVTGGNGRSTTEYSMARDVAISSKTGYTRENLNRISAIKECVENREDLDMVWAAKIFKSWQSASSVRLRHGDSITITWGAAFSRKQKVRAHAFTLEDVDTSEEEIDSIVSGERRLRRRDVLVAPDGANAGPAGVASTGSTRSTAGGRCTPSPSGASPSTTTSGSRKTSGKRRISSAISPECGSECGKEENMKTPRVDVDIKDVATVGENADERELREMKRKREEILQKSELIGTNRERAVRSAEEALAKNLEEAKRAYDEAVRQSQRVFAMAKQKGEERYRKEMEAVEACKQELFRAFWGQQ